MERIQRVQRIDTTIGGDRLIALRYRISSTQWCPWLVAIGECVLPFGRYARGRFLSKLYATLERNAANETLQI